MRMPPDNWAGSASEKSLSPTVVKTSSMRASLFCCEVPLVGPRCAGRYAKVGAWHLGKRRLSRRADGVHVWEGPHLQRACTARMLV